MYLNYGTQIFGQSAHANAAAATFLIVWGLIVVIADWKVFSKAGEAGWKSLIPVYRDYIQFKCFAGSTLMFFVYIFAALLSVLPVFWIFGYPILAITIIILNYRKALSFGKSGAFAIGLIILSPIFECILGFGKARYLGVRGMDLGSNFNGFGNAAGQGYSTQQQSDNATNPTNRGYSTMNQRKPGVDPNIIDVEPINPSRESDEEN